MEQSLLARIPAEVRLEIYRELLISPDMIDIDWKSPKLHPNIMRTCKAIFRESHSILYDENTFLVRIGIPQSLKSAVPNTPPVQEPWEERFRLDEQDNVRSLEYTYLHDVFPQFLPISSGLCRNRSFCSRKKQHNYYDKLPSRLAVMVECGNIKEYCTRNRLNTLAKSLQKIPFIRSLSISCENAPPSFWSTSLGIMLGEMLCAYIGGRGIRHIHTVITHNIPQGYADVLVRAVKSAKPTSTLLLMWRAFCSYYIWLPVPFGDWLNPGSHYYEACRAMETGDKKAFLHHREQALRNAPQHRYRYPTRDSVYMHHGGAGAE